MKQKMKKLALMMAVLAGVLLGAWKYLPATDFQSQVNESRKYGTTGAVIVKGHHKPIKAYATRWYVATVNRGLLPCGNRAAYN
jgi:hypothetical protein